MILVGRVGGDRRDLEPGEEATQRVVEVGVDLLENLVEMRHGLPALR
jgi:hypothetical protein